MTKAQCRLQRGGAILLLSTVLAVSGCASGPNAHPEDPFEPYNRSMSRFNDGLDKAVLKPVATAYEDVTPQPVRTGVRNFFANLGDAWSLVNNLLQLRGEGAFNSLVRFSTNSVLGLGGVLDIASEVGVTRHPQDFGMTLARWGAKPGPYVVLPILGSSTMRDAVALPVDLFYSPIGLWEQQTARYSLQALRLVNQRANLLGASSLLDAAALDPYSMTRDVFLKLREKNTRDVLPDDQEEDGDDGKLSDDYE